MFSSSKGLGCSKKTAQPITPEMEDELWTKETFQRVSVGFYINVKVICYQLELGNVPVGKAVSIIRERLREDETLGDRTLLPGMGCRATGEVPEVHLLSAMEETFMSRRKVW